MPSEEKPHPKEWICEGTCQSVVSQDEHADGQRCATTGCNRYGQPLVERFHCPICGEYYKEENALDHKGTH